MFFQENIGMHSNLRKRNTVPIVFLNIVLFVEFVFVAVMVVTMVYSEQQVRTSMERQIRLERLQGDILHLDEVKLSTNLSIGTVAINSTKVYLVRTRTINAM